MKAAESYLTLFGKPRMFFVNKTFFKKVMAWFIQEKEYPMYSDEEFNKIELWGVHFDVSDMNSDEYLLGIHSDISIKRIGIGGTDG